MNPSDLVLITGAALGTLTLICSSIIAARATRSAYESADASARAARSALQVTREAQGIPASALHADEVRVLGSTYHGLEDHTIILSLTIPDEAPSINTLDLDTAGLDMDALLTYGTTWTGVTVTASLYHNGEKALSIDHTGIAHGALTRTRYRHALYDTDLVEDIVTPIIAGAQI